jgi:hypothetical protein
MTYRFLARLTRTSFGGTRFLWNIGKPAHFNMRPLFERGSKSQVHFWCRNLLLSAIRW